jgi:hypothetical protein
LKTHSSHITRVQHPKAFQQNDVQRRLKKKADQSISRVHSNPNQPASCLVRKKKYNPAKKEEPHVPAHCPIRTSDLCITSATPYHLAKQAFDWSGFESMLYLRLLALPMRRACLALGMLMMFIPLGGRLEVGLHP